MLGAVGGLSGWLWTAGATAPAAILLTGAVAVVAAAYVAGSRQDIDGTTEVAALVVLAAGLLAGLGSVRLASGIVALLTLLLVEKSRLHALVQRIDDVGLASLRSLNCEPLGGGKHARTPRVRRQWWRPQVSRFCLGTRCTPGGVRSTDSRTDSGPPETRIRA